LSRLRQGDPAEDFRIAIDSNAKTVGFGHVWEASQQEVRGFVRLRPSAKGLGVGGALLYWLEQRAGAIAEDLDPDAVLTLTHWAKDTDAAPVLESAGFVPIRHFLQMRIDVSIGTSREHRGPTASSCGVSFQHETRPSSSRLSARLSPSIRAMQR
jgi:hypothetical protein